MQPLHPLILASTSATRRQMMQNAGLTLHFQASNVDEDAIRTTHAGSGPKSMAQILADAKALSILAPGSIVIGADQTLEIDGRVFSKARTIAGARQQLLALRGQTLTSIPL